MQELTLSKYVPAVGSRWLHENGTVYRVIMIANAGASDDRRGEYPIMIVYRDASNDEAPIWAQTLWDFLEKKSAAPLNR